MRCSCCGKEIKNGESFYEIEGEYYCEDCCVECYTVTYYSIGESEPISEDDIGMYDSIEELVTDLKFRIKFREEKIKRLKKDLSNYEENFFHYKILNNNLDKYTREIESIKEQLKELED